jgi:hypothetical protein
MFPDAAGQGVLLADYAHSRYGALEIAVIREKGTAGEEFASAFRDRARSQGVRIAADLEFLPAEATSLEALNAIAQKLASLPKGAIVVLGVQYAESPAVLRVLRDKLGPFTSMGYSSLATEGLSAQFAQIESDRHLPPGYYTNDFHVAAPQLGDVAEYAQTVFANRYKLRYGAEPSPEAVRWHAFARSKDHQSMPAESRSNPNPVWLGIRGKQRIPGNETGAFFLRAGDRPPSHQSSRGAASVYTSASCFSPDMYSRNNANPTPRITRLTRSPEGTRLVARRSARGLPTDRSDPRSP